MKDYIETVSRPEHEFRVQRIRAEFHFMDFGFGVAVGMFLAAVIIAYFSL